MPNLRMIQQNTFTESHILRVLCYRHIGNFCEMVFLRKVKEFALQNILR